jgi:hypothetical protein
VTYLLDSNVFIEAKNRHYGFDFCPAFWDWVVAEHGNGTVFSVEQVEEELLAGEDTLSTWAQGRGSQFFVPPDAQVATSLSTVATWARGADYTDGAVSQFLQAADFYLVAHAHANQCVVVTHERTDKGKKKIKIPNACLELGVAFMSPYDMLRAEQARFVLGP